MKIPFTLLIKCLAVGATTLALASCGPLISFGDTEPETVYTLTYPASDKDAPDGPVLFISEPGFSQGLGGRNVSVKLADNERTTVKNLRWSTSVSSLIRDFMVAGLRDRSNARAIGEDGLDVKTRCRLNSYIWAMDFLPGEARSQDAIDIRIELSLIDLDEGTLIASEEFAGSTGVDGTPAGITTGFTNSMIDMMPNLGRWLDNHLTSCAPQSDS